MTAAQRLQAWNLNRQADQLKRRVNAGLYRQSAHQTGAPAQRDHAPDAYGSPWFALVAITAAFAVDYVCADDQRIERDQQAQPKPSAAPAESGNKADHGPQKD